MRREWNSLLNRIGDNTYFLSWERVAPAVKFLKHGSSIKLLCATEGGEVYGIAPLRKASRSFKGRAIYNVLESLSDRAFGILLAERKAECLNKFLTHLYEQKDWAFLYFNEVPETFSVVDLLKNNSRSIPHLEVKEAEVSPYLTIPASLDDFFGGLPAKFRKDLRRSMRRLEREHGKIELKNYSELGSIEKMMEIFFDLHQKRWVAKEGCSMFNIKRNREMFLYEAKLFSEIKCLRLDFLLVNDKPISAMYGFEHNGVMHSLLTGFDPNYASYSPNNLHHFLVLERCIRDKIEEFNFFGGFTSHKFKWCNTFRRNYTFRFINNTFCSNALNLGVHFAKNPKFNNLLPIISF